MPPCIDSDDPYPHVDMGVAIATLAERLAVDLQGTAIDHVAGGGVLDATDTEIAAAANAAAAADLAIVAVGDRSGLFGRGTSGEGCDAPSHALPGRQSELLEAVLDSGTPTVVVVISGRPYALGSAPDRAAAIVQAFLPGQEGAGAVSAVLTGAAEPEGRLPVGVPARPDSPPATYLAPELARRSSVSSVDPTARYVFGHGLSYTEFTWDAPELLSGPEVGPEGTVEVAVRVRNTGDRPGAEVVQLYLHDPVATAVRPVQRLVGFARLDAGPRRGPRGPLRHAGRPGRVRGRRRRMGRRGRDDRAASGPLGGRHRGRGPGRGDRDPPTRVRNARFGDPGHCQDCCRLILPMTLENVYISSP